MSVKPDFSGLHILITRPAQQSAAICQQLAQGGALVSRLPVIEIAPPSAQSSASHTLQQIDKYDNVIFISRNAVVWAWRLDETLAAKLGSKRVGQRVGAIGNKTAATLLEQGVAAADVPATGFTSEDFLALDSMQNEHIAGHKILIVRGAGGRELLAQTLEQRGAQVDYVEVYRRACPPAASARSLLVQQARQPLDVIAITSCEGLQNLVQLLQSPGWLFNTRLLAGSQRIATMARQLGFKADITVAANPGDAAMLAALAGLKQDK